MAPHKETFMAIKVDLDCPRCYKKVKKLLCSIPQIQDQVYKEKQNIVMIKVVCCSPEKIRDKIRCKGGKTIIDIQIVEPPKPPPPKPPTVTKPDPPKQPPAPPSKPDPPYPIQTGPTNEAGSKTGSGSETVSPPAGANSVLSATRLPRKRVLFGLLPWPQHGPVLQWIRVRVWLRSPSTTTAAAAGRVGILRRLSPRRVRVQARILRESVR